MQSNPITPPGKGSESELDLLRTVKAKLGRNYKSAIREAWMNGNYSNHGLSEWSSQLQNMRNNLGPSWLVDARP